MPDIRDSNPHLETAAIYSDLTTVGKVKSRTEEFCEMFQYITEFNPKITKEEFNRLITNGEKIAQNVLHNTDYKMPETTTKDDCRALAFYLQAFAFKEEAGTFARGVVRVTNSQSTNIYSFMKRCHVDGYQASYERISSHFPRKSEGMRFGLRLETKKDTPQIGINFQKGELHDSELGTMLCGQLEEGGCFIKFEREGLDFKKDLTGSIKHCVNWGLHTLNSGGKKEIKNMVTRRETDGCKEVDQLYQRVIKTVNQSFKKYINPEELKALKERVYNNSDRIAGVELIESRLGVSKTAKLNKSHSTTSLEISRPAKTKPLERSSSDPAIHISKGRAALSQSAPGSIGHTDDEKVKQEQNEALLQNALTEFRNKVGEITDARLKAGNEVRIHIPQEKRE